MNILELNSVQSRDDVTSHVEHLPSVRQLSLLTAFRAHHCELDPDVISEVKLNKILSVEKGSIVDVVTSYFKRSVVATTDDVKSGRSARLLAKHKHVDTPFKMADRIGRVYSDDITTDTTEEQKHRNKH